MKGRVALLLALACAAAGYAGGIYSYPRNLWPLPSLRALLGKVPLPYVGVHDRFSRLTSYPGKVEVACPPPAPGTAVILAIGQSNISNFGATRIATRHPDKVLNLFAGKCHVAGSPLLGTTGERGEFLTPMADRLIDSGVYQRVILLPQAISDTPIARWQAGGDLNDMVLDELKTLPAGYRVTHVLWHQGERDLSLSTSTRVYQASFRSMLAALAEAGVTAPVFLAVATACGQPTEPGNPVAAAQRGLVDDRTIFLGADTDALLGKADRGSDACHLSESGQRKTAEAYATAIERARR